MASALQTDENAPEEDVDGDVLGDGEALHHPCVRVDKDDVADVERGAQVVVLVGRQVSILEDAQNRTGTDRVPGGEGREKTVRIRELQSRLRGCKNGVRRKETHLSKN